MRKNKIESLTESVFCGDLPDRVRVEKMVVGNTAKLMLAVTKVVLTAAMKSFRCNYICKQLPLSDSQSASVSVIHSFSCHLPSNNTII